MNCVLQDFGISKRCCRKISNVWDVTLFYAATQRNILVALNLQSELCTQTEEKFHSLQVDVYIRHSWTL
jgi:hypothetical protein